MIKQVFKTMVAFLAVATMTIGPAWGQNASPDVTLDFTDNTSWGFPAGKANITYAANSYTSGGYTITLQGGGSSSNGYYFNSGYLMLGKTDAYLQLPAFSSPVEKIEVVGNSGASPQVEQNVYVDDNNSWVAVSTSTTGATGTKTYVINESYRATGKVYFIKVGSNHNTQITSIKVYYVSSGGGSGSETPTPGQNASEENIFQYCYDCQRNPAYPTATASTSLSDFANPLVGYNGSGFEVNNTPAGPWKLEYMGIWSTTNQYGIEDFRVTNYQYIYNCTDVPVFRLYQWNATANEYQHASYGVVCAYAKVSNAVEHTAFFEAADGWGCVLTNSSHSSSMNVTFDEDLTTGITTLIPAPAVPHTVRFAAGNDGWTVTDVDSTRSATAPAVLQNVMAGDSLVVTAPATLPGKVKSVKAVKYVPPVLVSSIVLDKQTAYLAKDSTMTLTASVLPENAADKSYTWSSDDITKATVNQNGVVTGVAGGTANIIATANDGSGVKDTCVVTVLSSVTLEGVTVLYASDNDNWETVIGYNPGVLYQEYDNVRLTSNGAFLFYDGTPVMVIDHIYPFLYNDYQWLRVVEIIGHEFFYHQGETWQQAISANRPYNYMWSIENGQVKFNGYQTLVDTNSEPVDPTATIDPSTVDYDLE